MHKNFRRSGGHSLCGQRLVRNIYNADGTFASSSNATVVGWLDADESEFFDDADQPAAIFRIRYLDGEVAGDEEDLEEHEVRSSILARPVGALADPAGPASEPSGETMSATARHAQIPSAADNVGLRTACMAGNLDEIRRLLDFGCDVNELEKEHGTTPLFAACVTGQVEAARLLLNRGADVEGGTGVNKPLLIACSEGHYGVVCLLIFVGRANINCGTVEGPTSSALFIASAKNHLTVVKLLLNRGADMSWRRYDGMTALIFACRNGRTELARLLIDRGADMNEALPDGRTCIHLACDSNHHDIVQLLITRGAVVDFVCNGMTPLEMAVSKGHYASAELLRPGITEAWEAFKLMVAKNDAYLVPSLVSAEQKIILAPILSRARGRLKADSE